MNRIQKIQKEIQKKKLSAVLISKPENVRYLCGFVGTNGRLLITPKKATLITDFRYLRSARKQIPRSVAIFNQTDGIKKLMDRFKMLGVEESFITHAQYQALNKVLKGIRLKGMSGLVEGFRMIKDKEEMKIMRKAVKIADAAFEKLVKTVKVGISEDDLEWNLLKFARQLGADGFSFSPIICFGKNTADVHHIKEPKRLKKGESVLIDMGISYKGYMTDMTRTFFTAKPSKKYQEIYETVLRANQKAIESIEVGMSIGEVDKVARDVIKKAGYGKCFGHSTGHGIGLEVHELPNVSPDPGPGQAQKSTTTIQPGMVFTVEPGIYLNDLGGVRIEDMVYVNEKGKAEVLTKPSKQLIVIKA